MSDTTSNSSVTVECIGCKGRRDVTSGEDLGPVGQPMCDRCLLPMVATSARTQ